MTLEKDRKVEGKQWLPAKWDYEADVVVVGYGTAGAAAAITAHDAGAEVLVLEKQRADTATFIDHTPSVRMAASSVLSPTSVADAAKHLELCCLGNTPRDVCQVWAEETSQNKAWLESIGGKVIKATDPAAGEGWELPIIPGYKSMMYVMHEKAGPGLWQTLANAVEKVRQIKVLYATAGKELVQNPVTKEILGVVADEAGKRSTLRLRKV